MQVQKNNKAVQFKNSSKEKSRGNLSDREKSDVGTTESSSEENEV